MKSIIQTISTLLIIVITFTSAEFVNANSSTADTLQVTTPVDKEAEFENIEKVLLYGLNSEVDGILESTLFNAVAYKALNPEFNSAAVIDEIKRIAVEIDTHVVRYKALVALSYMKDQESFDVSDRIKPLIKANDANGMFQVLVDSIQEKQLVQTRNR